MPVKQKKQEHARYASQQKPQWFIAHGFVQHTDSTQTDYTTCILLQPQQFGNTEKFAAARQKLAMLAGVPPRKIAVLSVVATPHAVQHQADGSSQIVPDMGLVTKSDLANWGSTIEQFKPNNRTGIQPVLITQQKRK